MHTFLADRADHYYHLSIHLHVCYIEGARTRFPYLLATAAHRTLDWIADKLKS